MQNLLNIAQHLPQLRIQIAYTTLATVILLSVGCHSGLPVNIELEGRVTKVHDGDSIHITPSNSKRVVVRLAAIDAPEITQEHGIPSRDYLRSLILNRMVSARCNKLDKYQRQICIVTHSAEDINLEMLKAGHAWYYTQYEDEQAFSIQRKYKKAESRAQRSKLGLWNRSKAIAPWEFRSKTR